MDILKLHINMHQLVLLTLILVMWHNYTISQGILSEFFGKNTCVKIESNKQLINTSLINVSTLTLSDYIHNIWLYYVIKVYSLSGRHLRRRWLKRVVRALIKGDAMTARLNIMPTPAPITCRDGNHVLAIDRDNFMTI